MKKYICVLASAALLAACEQKTETVAPGASPAAGKTENNTTIVNPSPAGGSHTNTNTSTNTTTTASSPSTTTESSSSTTTSSPSPR